MLTLVNHNNPLIKTPVISDKINQSTTLGFPVGCPFMQRHVERDWRSDGEGGDGVCGKMGK